MFGTYSTGHVVRRFLPPSVERDSIQLDDLARRSRILQKTANHCRRSEDQFHGSAGLSASSSQSPTRVIQKFCVLLAFFFRFEFSLAQEGNLHCAARVSTVESSTRLEVKLSHRSSAPHFSPSRGWNVSFQIALAYFNASSRDCLLKKRSCEKNVAWIRHRERRLKYRQQFPLPTL